MYCLRNIVCGENQDCVVWYFVNLFNKDSFMFVQVIDYVVVMYYFVMDIYWCVVNGQCVFNNVDSVVYFGIKIMWVG